MDAMALNEAMKKGFILTTREGGKREAVVRRAKETLYLDETVGREGEGK